MMNKKVKFRVLFIFIFAFMVLSTFFVYNNANVDVRADNVAAPAINSNLFYGKSKLSGNLLSAYNEIYSKAESKNGSIRFSSQLTEDEFNRVLSFYILDHGEHYWWPNRTTKVSSGNMVIGMNVTYNTGFDDNLFQQNVQEYLSLVPNNATEYEKALIIHNVLVKNVKYVEAANAHNAYGAIVEGEAVCEGYAEAYQYLLYRCGIQCFAVTGKSHNEAHEWNLVRLDGNYYYTDVTWDDPVLEAEDAEQIKPIYYAYFNITYERLTEDHDIIDNDLLDILPACTDEGKMYSRLVKVSDYTQNESDVVSSMASSIEVTKNVGTIRVYLTSDTYNYQHFYNWFIQNEEDIINQTIFSSVRPIQISFSSCGREGVITLTGPKIFATDVNISDENITLYLKNNSNQQLTVNILPNDCNENVIWSSSNKNVATVNNNGNVIAHSVGETVITVTVGSKSATCNVTVLNCKHLAMQTIQAKTATCTEQGWDAYKKCGDCNQLFNFADDSEISEVPYTALEQHNYGSLISETPAHDCTNGMKSHYCCSTCNNYFDDNKQQVSMASLIIPAPHNYENSEPVWKWVNKQAFATFKCANCNHEEEIEAEVTESALEDKENEKELTANLVFNGQEYSTKKTIIEESKKDFNYYIKKVKEFFTFNNKVEWYVGLAVIVGGLLFFCVLIRLMFRREKKKS